MQQPQAAVHAEHALHAEHQHHWETSWGPMAAAFGALFLVPLTFSAYFVYESALLAIVFAGIGVPLTLAGIARWVYEGATIPAVKPNISPLGIGVFIAGEVLIFLGLFVSYWSMRISSGMAGEVWPPAGTPHINLVLPLIMTAILVASSLTYHYGEVQFEHGKKGSFALWLIISFVLASAFLACTGYEYVHLHHAGFTPATNSFSFAFYSLTGFHGSHVLVGMVSFLVILIALAASKVSPMLVKVAGIYWHFVDVVWFFVASQVYYW